MCDMVKSKKSIKTIKNQSKNIKLKRKEISVKSDKLPDKQSIVIR